MQDVQDAARPAMVVWASEPWALFLDSALRSRGMRFRSLEVSPAEALQKALHAQFLNFLVTWGASHRKSSIRRTFKNPAYLIKRNYNPSK